MSYKPETLTSPTSSLVRIDRTFATYYSRFPFRETETVQLSRGQLVHRSFEVWGSRCIFARTFSDLKIATTAFAGPDWMMFMWPVSWRDDFKVNGRVTEPGSAYLMDGAIEWLTTGAERELVMLGIRRDALLRACAGLKGVNHVALARGNRVYRFGRGSDRFLHWLNATMVALSRTGTLTQGRLLMPAVLEADVISSLAAWVTGYNGFGDVYGRDQRSALQVVRQAKEALQENARRPMSIAEICAAIGVGRTKLHECFVDLHGISAAQYIKKQRMTAVREQLLDPVNPPVSVKGPALAYGFHTSGRFAREYKSMFGELPSTTLHRARQLK